MPQESLPPNWRKNINLFLTSQFLTGISSMVVQYSIIWYLTEQTKSASILSVATLLGMIPMVFLSPFIGGFVDRLNKKMLLIVPDIVAALVAIVLSTVGSAAGSFPLWLVFISLFIRSVAQTFQMPTIQSIIPAMVPAQEITKINGQLGMVQSANFIVAPALGAFLYSFVSINFLLLLDVVGAIVGIGLLMMITIPVSKAAVEKVHVIADAVFGFKSLMSNKGIWYVTLGGTVFMLFFMPAVSMYPLMTVDYFNGTIAQAGIVEVVYSVGMLAGGAIIGFFGNWKNRMPLVIFSFFGVGLTFIISGVLPGNFNGYVAFAVLNFIGGLVGSLWNILYMAVVQQSYPQEELGRVMSVMNAFMSAAGPVGLIFAGTLADSIGVEKLFLIGGIGAALCGIFAAMSASVRNIDRDLHARLAAEEAAQ